jgi:shikimate dehydrogenase
VIAISARSPVYCVLGHPVGHSISPRMQNAALAAMRLDGVYVAFDVAPGRLPEAVRGLRALGIAGANVTIPHKEAMPGLLDRVEPEAALIGAVNTVVPRDGGLIGANTDAPGFLASLRAEGVEPAGARAVLLGAGGSARAVAVALAGAGATVALVNRTEARAEGLVALLNERVRAGCAVHRPWSGAVLEELLAESQLLVNCTSLGMYPEVDAMPELPERALGPHLAVYDLIYNPWETRLLRAARARGCRAINGAGMLAWQGALALERWTGRAAPVALMKQVIQDALAGAK